MDEAIIPESFEDDDDGEPFVVVNEFVSESDAADAARLLIENGIGASVTSIAAGDETKMSHRVEVLAHEEIRAAEVLGLVEPAPRPAGGDSDEPMKAEKAPTPWKQLALIWVAAMVLIPLAAFAITYFAVSR